MRSVLLLLLLGTLCELSYQIGFARPSFVVPVKTGSYGSNMVWRIGDVEKILFDTPWPEYKIEFWQQSLIAPGAVLAKKLIYQRETPFTAAPLPPYVLTQHILLETRGQDLPQVINWTVTTEEFDANDSPVFFFWLREVNDSKGKDLISQSSAFFNITEKPVEDSPTTTQSPSSKAPTSTSSISSGSSSSSTESSPSSTTSGVLVPQPTAADNNQPPGAAPDQHPPYQQSSGLSTGATAGIGVGVGIAAIAGIACAIMLFLNRRKGEKTRGFGPGVSSMPPFPNQAPQQQQQQPSYYPPQYGMGETFVPNEPPKGFPQYRPPLQATQELSDYRLYSTELPADQGWTNSQTPINQR
ncbi:hypothetical protein PG993_014488 [Apiospora rasikravindrae]|uniref:Mid2 domain-containing protein n=1 Tax=Apiospora rasikravindrae TaxID=990691 RepID=A0ABR1RMU2_9PEZI